ncbi:MAG TPA: SprT-like domain-containing protein [Tepidisphaeraceae bacterium]|jgi:predicted SprT family Zn-dependent metalloprotease
MMNLYAARDLARELMKQHGLSGWTFRYDHARRRFGSCRYRAKVITLSKPLTFLNTEDQVRDTILHEIAHALAPEDGHGAKWKAVCRQIGANPKRCYSDEEVVSPPRREARYEIGCARCGWWHDRHRTTRRKLVCRACRERVVIREKVNAR